MKTILEAQIYLEDKINRLRAIHYITTKLTFEKLTDEQLKNILSIITAFANNKLDLKYLRIELAHVSEELVSLNCLRTIACDAGISKFYKMNKTTLLSKLKGVKV